MRLACFLVLAGCLPHPTGDVGPAPTDPTAAPEPVASGVYQVRSQIDLTIEVVLPDTAADLVVTLRELSTAPAHTLITLADEAGVPAVSELRAALPDLLESRLEGWIDDEIGKLTVGGAPITQLAAETAALAETALTHVALDSELTIADGRATHRLIALDFAPAGLDAQLALGALPDELIRATAPASSHQGALTLGDHVFSLAYGAYAWRALDAACVARHGANLRATLGSAIDCPALANRLASKCVLGVCVGHVAELTELCERGLDEVVDRARAKVAALKFDALHLAAGTATVADRADRLDHGEWSAQLNVGFGLRHAPATFTATR